MVGCRPFEGDNMPDSVNHFEMRRLEALSNTIFGVAMTLLATNLPKGQVLDGAPIWSTISAVYLLQVIALLISFVVAGMFWISHQRRLAYQTHATRPVLYLNFLFLLSIVVLPVTCGLLGSYGNSRDIVVLYSCHLTVLAGLNGVLWLLAGLLRRQPSVAAGMAFATAIFILATFFALIIPQTFIAKFIWCFGFATPMIDGVFEKRRQNQTT
jgi:uncharacterized membrane protein